MPIARAAIDSAADAVAAKAAGGGARPSFDRPLDLRMSSSAFVDVSGEFGTAAADVSEKGRHTPSLEYSNLTGLPPPPAARDGAAPPTEQGLAVAALGEKISTLERFIADQKANTSAGSTPRAAAGSAASARAGTMQRRRGWCRWRRWSANCRRVKRAGPSAWRRSASR